MIKTDALDKEVTHILGDVLIEESEGEFVREGERFGVPLSVSYNDNGSLAENAGVTAEISAAILFRGVSRENMWVNLKLRGNRGVVKISMSLDEARELGVLLISADSATEAFKAGVRAGNAESE